MERDPSGLSVERLASSARLIAEANRGELDVRNPPLGAYGIANLLPGPDIGREQGTTAVTGLLIGSERNQIARLNIARQYIEARGDPPKPPTIEHRGGQPGNTDCEA